MACINPFIVSYKLKGLAVGCGKCLQCRIAHARMWSTRIMHEYLSANCQGLSMCLTYATDSLPVVEFGDKLCMTLNKRDVQLFFKRLRKDLSKSIKYFLAGEYGDTHGRPHYHAIVIGYSMIDICEYIEKHWIHGSVHFGTVTYDSARYLVKYQMKSLGKKRDVEVWKPLEPPFAVMSKGIGRKWFEDHYNDIIYELRLVRNGKPIPVPRYYWKRLEKMIDPYFFSKIKENREKILSERYMNGLESDLGVYLNDTVFDISTDRIKALESLKRHHDIQAENALKNRCENYNKGDLQ